MIIEKTMRFFSILFIIPLLLVANTLPTPEITPIVETKSIIREHQWVDSLYQTLSEDERLGQLFMIRAHSDKGAEHIAEVERLIRTYHVGGLCFFQGTPGKQAELTNRYQSLSHKIPLMVAIDAEWGLGMRLKKSISFPRHQMLGAIQDNRVLYEMGQEVARQLRLIGTHINFAPVVDINSNPANPIINTRSFGEDRHNVAEKSYAYMKGMQDHDILACAKHFPNHGGTDVDSHLDLPVLNYTSERLDSIELYPFKALAKQGIGSMMVAHLHVPALDDRKNRPTSLSDKVITDLLKEEMDFNGLVFTDALEMRGVTNFFKSGELEAEALQAGVDVLALPMNIKAAFRGIKQYIQEGKIPREQIEKSVKKILHAKYKQGLHEYKPAQLKNLYSVLNSNQALALKRKLIRHALTLVRNHGELLPIRYPEKLKLASLSIGTNKPTVFQQTLAKYADMPHFQSSKDISSEKQANLLKKLKNEHIVFVSLHGMNNVAGRNFGISQSAKKFIKALQRETRVVLVVFGNPYGLKYFDDVDYLLAAYEDNKMTQDLAAQALFGAFGLSGRLPITASEKSRFGDGISTFSLGRLGYDLPESVGLNSDTLSKIDSIIQDAIDEKATPGAVVLIAKDGKIVFEKAYGYQTYEKKRAVKKTDLYDLASVTKIAAATLSVMKLQEEGIIDVNKPLKTYLTELDTTNKAGIIIKDMMAHRAGLKDWLRFYYHTISNPGGKNPRPLKELYRPQSDSLFSLAVTEKLYLRSDFADSIWQQIKTSDLRKNKKYKYSDLGFYLIADLVHRMTGKTIDEYTRETFYEPLGLNRITYNPWKQFPIEEIAPTEEDSYFRRQKIQGYVHDMGAAMLGGVSGHAGLFADAGDLAVVMQLLLNKGYYGGRQHLNPKTINEFTSRHPKETRRATGFDMKQLNSQRTANMSPLASSETFGHLGFTGTCAWVDPRHNIVFVCLANRTYPSMNNSKYYRMDVRPNVQTVVYEAMEK